MIALQAKEIRMSQNAGIAIGPILFIIAILAILASAIAAGSGTFTASTGSETNKTKSSALVQIGENLRLGMDEITLEGGLSPQLVNFSYTDTTVNNGLFAPTGGGIAPPSVGMANNPMYDTWIFAQGTPAGIGSGNANDVIAFLPVSAGVCAEVNSRSTGTAGYNTTATTVFSGTTAATAQLLHNGVFPATGATWTLENGGSQAGPDLSGVGVGCIYDTTLTLAPTTAGGPTSPYYFYQILAIQ
jgi:hypothetical protein